MASLARMVGSSLGFAFKGTGEKNRVMRRFGALVLACGAMLLLSACSGKTTGATSIGETSATLHASASCDAGQRCTWYWEYWLPSAAPPLGLVPITTPVQGPVSGPASNADLTTTITELLPDEAYRWVFCASPNDGGVYRCAGPGGVFDSTPGLPVPTSDYATFTTFPVRTLAEVWNGSSWAIQSTPNPSANLSYLQSGSCTSVTACTAVGYTKSNPFVIPGEPVQYGVSDTLAEAWDGSSWTIQPTVNPDHDTVPQVNQLNGVSCTSSAACTATGGFLTGGPRADTLAERWDGSSWTMQSTPNASSLNQFSAVSCASATACTGVGTTASGSPLAEAPFAEGWDGTSWTVQPTPPTPAGSSTSGFSGVSCTSVVACIAVGSSTVGGVQQTLAERWDGTSWTIQPSPHPSGAQSSSLSGVSCTSAITCTAVGSYTDSAGVQQTLVERWDGTNWTIQPSGNRARAKSSSLNGVSCMSSTACTAVGSYINKAGVQHTLAEGWDGTTWKIERTPRLSGQPTFSSVSCTSTTACTAFGSQ